VFLWLLARRPAIAPAHRSLLFLLVCNILYARLKVKARKLLISAQARFKKFECFPIQPMFKISPFSQSELSFA
jgi:hypothetical protein